MDVPDFAAAQARRRELLDRIGALAPERRVRAAEGALSPLGLLEHLNSVDHLVLGEMEARPGRGSRHVLLPVLIRRMRAGKSVPLPSAFAPKGGRAYDDLKADSDATHARLAEVLTRATEADVIARHPIFGDLTARQACELMDSHYDYHLQRFAEPS